MLEIVLSQPQRVQLIVVGTVVSCAMRDAE